jgi:hypothetical protein
MIFSKRYCHTIENRCRIGKGWKLETGRMVQRIWSRRRTCLLLPLLECRVTAAWSVAGDMAGRTGI